MSNIQTYQMLHLYVYQPLILTEILCSNIMDDKNPPQVLLLLFQHHAKLL